MYSEIHAAIQSLKVITQIVSANRDLANYNELASLTAALNEKLLDATSAALESKEKEAALLAKVRELEEIIAEKEDWVDRSSKYKLVVVGAEENNFVYAFQPSGEADKPRHWACSKCFEIKKISILNQRQHTHYYCPNCELIISPIVRGGGLAPVDSAYET